jgi:hypothetical protein
MVSFDRSSGLALLNSIVFPRLTPWGYHLTPPSGALLRFRITFEIYDALR